MVNVTHDACEFALVVEPKEFYLTYEPQLHQLRL